MRARKANAQKNRSLVFRIACPSASIRRESRNSESRVHVGGLNRHIQEQTPVQEFLDMERDLDAFHSLVIRELNFYGYIEERVVVRVSVESDRYGQQRRRVEVHIGGTESGERIARAGNLQTATQSELKVL